jgi:hypothetical protein
VRPRRVSGARAPRTCSSTSRRPLRTCRRGGGSTTGSTGPPRSGPPASWSPAPGGRPRPGTRRGAPGTGGCRSGPVEGETGPLERLHVLASAHNLLYLERNKIASGGAVQGNPVRQFSQTNGRLAPGWLNDQLIQLILRSSSAGV